MEGKMIITKKINTKWNSKTKLYYESLGYQFTKMGDSFSVRISDLKKSSHEKILVECDYCHQQYYLNFSDIKSSPHACKKCKHLKAQNTVRSKYGVENIMFIKEFKEKRDKTIFDTYGVKNVFSLKETKEKIYKTNMSEYGKKSFTQTSSYNKKRKQTCIEKYGEDSHMKTKKYKEMFTGKNNPVWKGGIHDKRWDRLQPKYKQWRESVFINDHFSCKKCGVVGGKLEAHHIFNWNDNPDKRYDINNGITFCINCHVEFHRKYGKKNNNNNQIKEYLHT